MRALFVAALLFSIALPAGAASRSSVVANGNWSNANTWSNKSDCTGAGGAGVPDAGDDVYICTTVNLTQNAVAKTVTINPTGAGGTLNLAGFQLSVADSPAITLNTGGAFNAGGGTLLVTNNANTTVASGTAASITFGTLTVRYSTGGTNTYTLAAGSIAAMSMAGDLNLTTVDDTNAARVLTVNAGTLTSLTVTGTTTIQAQAGTDASPDDAVVFNTGGIPITSGRLILGGGGTAGTDTLNAGASTLTLNGGTGPLFTRNSNGLFTAGTSRVVMSPTASVALTAGTFTGTSAFNNLTVTVPAGQTGTLGAAIAVNGTAADALNITSGTLADGGFQIAGNATGGMSMASGTDLWLGTAATATVFPTGFVTASIALNAASTVTYNSDQAQTMSATPVYGNVVLASTAAVTKTPAGALDINGNLTINAGNTLSAGAATHTLAGNFTNNGTYTASTGTMTFDGTSPATLGGTSATTFNNMTVNKPGTTLTLSTSPTVNNTLTLTAGTVVTGSNKISLAAAGTVAGVGATSSAGASNHVRGNFEKAFNGANLSFTYPVGDGTNYTPITVAFTTLTTSGNLTATTGAPAADHLDTLASRTGIEPSTSVNRWWTLKGHPAPANLTAGGPVTAPGVYTVTLNYLAADVDGGSAAGYVVGRGESCATSGASRTCNPWGTLATSGTPTTTQAAASGALLMVKDLEADFVVGRPPSPASKRFARQKEFIYTREQY
jgi:hypothetical protein